jgi:hypothetical protein
MIQETLQKPYDRSRWTSLLAEVFPNVSIYEKPQRSDETSPDFVRDFIQLGHVRLEDGKNLAIFEVKVAGKIDISRNRVALRDFVARQMNLGTTHGVLCVFNSSEPTYRFTFVCKETTLDDAGQITTTETNPRRFTYILGPGETRRTAAERFKELAARRDHAGMKEIIEAFSVERLNKEFFDSYKRHYQAFVDHLVSTDAPARVFGIDVPPDSKDFAAACKPVRDWVKRLLGRIVFLHFLQKKGWMGVPPESRNWAGGDPKFLQSLFADCRNKDLFHSTRLAKLFTEALNRPDRKGDLFDITGTRVPYLNGGLFEDDDSAAARLDFPAPLFAGLLDFLGAYNFTIDENDPDENEVGIDPEMLGHIFENLLEDNKDKGAFYTPKNAVQYMCQESLIRFFASRFGYREEICRLVRLKDPGDRDDPDNWIRQNARAIESALDAIKICDPAIGSGAFPIGLLQEIFWIKLTLDWTLDPAETKRRIIQNSIYGVDLDPGAVEIARLRFWLALVVDEKEPRPLPNLEFSIYCADSLVEYVRGEPVNLGKLASDDRSSRIVARLISAKHDYFQAERVPAKRKALAAIYSSLAELAQYEFSWLKTEEGMFGDAGRAAQLAHAESEIGFVLRQLAGMPKLGASEQDAMLDRIRSWFHDPAKPTFLWELHFGEVFAQGGFDIVIANPPYISVEKFSRTEIQSQWKARYEKTYASRGDIYCFFYEKGLDLLKPDGHLCFITSNKFMRAGYGKGLRTLLAMHRIDTIIDFCELPVFAAATDPAITQVTKTHADASHQTLVAVIKDQREISSLLSAINRRGSRVHQSEIKPSGWTLEGQDGMAVLAKMRAKGTPLKEFVGGSLYRGIITGLNEAFVIDESTRSALIASDPNSAKLIRKWIRGKDIKRWHGEWNGLYAIIFPFGFHQELSKFPAILRHLTRFKDKLMARGQCTSSRGGGTEGQHHWLELDNNPKQAYLDAFDRPKLVFNETSKELHAYVDRDGYAINKTGFIITTPVPDFLLSVMMSKAMDFLFRSEFPSWGDPWLEGRVQFRGDRMATIPIPPATPADQSALTALAKRAAESTGSELASIEREIDQIVYRLFDLTAEEIALIQSRLLSKPSAD